MNATLAVFGDLVNAPVINTDCPGLVSLETQKIEFAEYEGVPIRAVDVVKAV